MTFPTLATIITPLTSLSTTTGSTTNTAHGAISLVQIVLCIGSLQIILYYILIRHIDARLAQLDFARRIERVDLVEGDESTASPALLTQAEEEATGDDEVVIEPFVGISSLPVSPTTSQASSSGQAGYSVNYNNTYANHLELSLHTHEQQYTYPSRSSSTWSHMPTPTFTATQRGRDAPSHTTPAYYSTTSQRPALYRSHSDPRPYRSHSPASSYIPSPLSRQCSLPCSPVYAKFDAITCTTTSTTPQFACTASNGSTSITSAQPSRCSTPVHYYQSSTPTCSWSASRTSARPCDVDAEADNDGPAMYTSAKLSFRRHKDAYASLSFDTDAISSTRAGRRQSRTEWVDLPPMYDEAWVQGQSRSQPSSPVDSVHERCSRSATL